MKGCRGCCSGWTVVTNDSKQAESNPTCTYCSTTMETDDSARIMNQSSQAPHSALAVVDAAPAAAGGEVSRESASRMLLADSLTTPGANVENSTLHLGSCESPNSANKHSCRANTGMAGPPGRACVEGYPELRCCPRQQPAESDGLLEGSCRRQRVQLTTSRRRQHTTPTSCDSLVMMVMMRGTKFLLLQAILTMILTIMVSSPVEAGFWTFYFPNFLKPSGYKELTDMIKSVENQINSTMDAHADALYFWDLMKTVRPDGTDEDNIDEYYPEESACNEAFPEFRDRAIEYGKIDFDLYMKPLKLYRQDLLEKRELWFPDGPKSKNILPRQYEHDLQELDLKFKLEAYEFLANEPELRQKREDMVNIWLNAKRGLDMSLPCLYLRYSHRHMAADIDQHALESNLVALGQAMKMLESAAERLALYKSQDKKAIEAIEDDIEREQNLVMID